MRTFTKYLISGIMTVVPLWVTWLVVDFVFRKLLSIGAPLIALLRRAVTSVFPDLYYQLHWVFLDKIFAVIMTVALFYLVGWGASHIFGQTILRSLENLLDRVPLIKSVYGGVRKAINAVQSPMGEGQEQPRVVLINFPSEKMKTVGLITRMITEEGTGRKLAVVYVPTTPNPTSGYLEIVPADQVLPTDWTLDEAMNFIVTAGAAAPNRPLRYMDRNYPFAAVPHS